MLYNSKMPKRLELSVGDRMFYLDQFGEQIKGTVVGVREKNGKRIYDVKYDYGAPAEFVWSNKYLFKEGDAIPEHILKEVASEQEDGDTTEDEEEEIPVLQRENLCANVDDAVEDETPVLKRQVSDDAGSDAPVLKRQRSDE